MSNRPAAIAVTINGVSKDFVLPHERIGSVKHGFLSLFKQKHRRTTEQQHALRNITFDIRKGEFFGVVGRNGSGKSTLLKILAGIYQPSAGKVSLDGKLVPFIELGVGFNPELTGRENVYLNGALLGFSNRDMDAQYQRIVEFSELEAFMDQKLKNYSSGMQVRLAFSVAIVAEADILLVDEVLAVGDAAFQRKCFNYFRELKKKKQTVVFVSHDMEAVRRFCDRAVLIEDSRLVMEGDAQKVADAYTKIFIKEMREEAEREGVGTESKTRWGDEAIRYGRPKVHVTPEAITIKAPVRVARTVDLPVFGFLVKNYDGTALFGRNTRSQIYPTIKRLDADAEQTISWEIPNILNNGKYTIDLAISYDDGATADWWTDAVGFEVIREEANPFLVNPDAGFALDKQR